MLTRRAVLSASGGVFVSAVISGRAAAADVVEIHMKSDPAGGVVGFDPVGVLLQPGQTVRWICDANVHTTTAYSPKNANHSLRIPKEAQPWASDFLQPGERFEVNLTVEGIYDYYCAPHEMAGMVGRLIVGQPGGTRALPFDYFKAEGKAWMIVPPAAQKAFPAIAEIMRKKVVRSPLNFSK
ncbi:MAG TPA: plastocyanin/azurin family copper-binding protein [Lacipirellulaceae bacterium]|nr:plastocyanin/azurin family copper-binding protein [Lacipirellulaceae bacterium]